MKICAGIWIYCAVLVTPPWLFGWSSYQPPTGRFARYLFVGLHVAEFIQSTLLRLPTRFGIRRAGRRFHFLLLGHLGFYPAFN